MLLRVSEAQAPPPPPPSPLAATGGACVEAQGAQGGSAAAPEAATSRFADQAACSATWDDLAGCADAKRALHDALLLPLLHSEFFARRRMSPPSAVLLHGPPGTGKTMLALAACNELRARGRDVALLRATPGTLLSKFVGESEANVRALFADARREARRCGNCVIFLDEIDALAPARGADGGHNGGASDPLARRVLTELLVCMSDCRRAEAEGAPGRVLVIAATNRPQDLDPACLRRFDRKTLVGLPAEPERMALLQRERTCRALQVNDSALAELAAATAGWSFNDLVALLDEACMCALRDASPEEAMPEVSPRHLQSALASVRQARRDVAPSP